MILSIVIFSFVYYNILNPVFFMILVIFWHLSYEAIALGVASKHFFEEHSEKNPPILCLTTVIPMFHRSETLVSAKDRAGQLV